MGPRAYELVKLLGVDDLSLDGVKVIRFGRFPDDRGYFTEPYRRSDLDSIPGLTIPTFVQCNESFSRAGVIRGLHFQWNPYMGKMVRTVYGRLVDFVLDVRKGSPTFGKIVACDLAGNRDTDEDRWIWIPPGFAHGTLFPQETLIEYLCTGEYSPGNEAAISPLAPDIDWSLCAPDLRALFVEIAATTPLMTAKDRDGFTLRDWLASPLSDNFVYSRAPA